MVHPDNKPGDAHRARKEPEESNEVEDEVQAGSRKHGPKERDQAAAANDANDM